MAQSQWLAVRLLFLWRSRMHLSRMASECVHLWTSGAFILFWFSMRNGEVFISLRQKSPNFIARVKDWWDVTFVLNNTHSLLFCLLSCGSFYVGSSVTQSCTILCFIISLLLLANAFLFSVYFIGCCTIKNNPGPKPSIRHKWILWNSFFFTSGLENCEKYVYVADRISPSWKCLISAVTYYPIVTETKNIV